VIYGKQANILAALFMAGHVKAFSELFAKCPASAHIID